MTYKLILLFLFTLTFNFTEEYTLVENSVELLKALEQSSNETNSIEAKFAEKQFLSMFNEPILSEGVFYYQKQRQMRWQQNEPFEYIMLLHDNAVRIKEAGIEKKVNSNDKIANKISGFIIGLIQGNFQNDGNYTIKCFESDDNYKLVLSPKRNILKKVFVKLELIFSKNGYLLNSIIFHENGGDKRVIDFYDHVLNKKISETIFTKF